MTPTGGPEIGWVVVGVVWGGGGRERRRCLRLDREAHILIALKKKMTRHRDFDLINSERSQAENFRTLVVCFIKAAAIFIKQVTGVRRLDRKSKIKRKNKTFRSISHFVLT